MPSASSPWARKAMAIVATLLGANLLLAVVGPSLPEPVTYPTREIQLAVDLLDDQTAEGCVDLLVTGNSLAAHDVSAAQLAGGLGLSSGVVSVLPGSVAAVDVDWLQRTTVPRTRPGTLVYVASPLTFAPTEVVEQFGLTIYRRSLAVRSGWVGDLQRWAFDHSPLVRYRLALADPETMAGWANDDLPESYAEVLEETGRTVDPDGHIRATGAFDGNVQFVAALREVAGTVVDEWRVDVEGRDALRRTLADLAAQGMRVVVVVPPVTDELIAAYPGGQAAYDEYLAAAASLAATGDVELLDLSAVGYDDSLFWDTHHLNQAGADRFTATLIDEMAAQPSPACDR